MGEVFQAHCSVAINLLKWELFLDMKLELCFSCTPKFRHHFLQKSPLSHTSSSPEFYLLMVCYSHKYPCTFCITQILSVHPLISPTKWYIPGGPWLYATDLQIPSIKDEIWEVGRIKRCWTALKWWARSVMTSTPILLCFVKLCMSRETALIRE